MLVGGGQSLTTATFVGSVATPLSLTTCPRNCVWRVSRLHLAGFNRNPALRMAVRTSRKFVDSLVKVSGMDQQIVQVDHTASAGNVFKDTLHQPFKGGWGVTQSKGHHPKLPQSLPYGKRSFWAGPLTPALLAIPRCASPKS